jgi:uncharacterized protein YqhQ
VSSKPSTQFTSIGGQAVIEGVMMRSPHFIAIAVRKPNRKIAIRYYSNRAISDRFPVLKKPVLRGVVTLIESMVQGIKALSYSAEVATLEEEETGSSGKSASEPVSDWALMGSVAVALLMGLGVFVALPHFLTTVLLHRFGESAITIKSPAFHLLDGLLKMSILLSYIYLIARMKDIYRVFQYHGAEHKSIYAFEAGEDLTVENARRHTTLHPRCGTSFLFFLILISILVFSAVFPLLGLTDLSSIPIVNHLAMILVKAMLMLPVAGLAYEFIKMCACRMDSVIFRIMIWPGMILQKLTTREPPDDQLEVALVSLRQVLKLEKEARVEMQTETEISFLNDLAPVAASVAEFPEV